MKRPSHSESLTPVFDKDFDRCGVLLAARLAIGGAKGQEAAAVKELIPTGKLRFGVAFAPHNPRNFISASLQAEAVELSPDCTPARIVRRTDIKE